MTGVLRLGLTERVPEQLYHRGVVDGEPSLSHSGMKTLLGKSPTHFRREVDHPEDREQKKYFDLGSAVHAYVLGAGQELIAEIRRGPATPKHPFGAGEPYDDFRTKDCQAKRDDAYSRGLVPILAKDIDRVHTMVAALRRHRLAGDLLHPGSGIPEVSAFARDPESGVLLRARFDWLRHDGTMVDFKTTSKLANPAAVSRSLYDLGYYLQAATYDHVARLCGLELTGFEFVMQETSQPYAPSVFHVGPASLELGRLRMRKAIDLYAACVASGEWPGYPDESVEVDVPFWALRELDAALPSTDDDTDDQVDSAALQLLDHLN